MTGPAEGKIPIRCERCLIRIGGRAYVIRPYVYVHVKGYSLARVTHVDVECEGIEKELGLDEVVPGILIASNDRITIRSASKGMAITLYTQLCEIFPRGYKGGCVVGGKVDGIFIGLRKEIINLLEEFARERGYNPR